MSPWLFTKGTDINEHQIRFVHSNTLDQLTTEKVVVALQLNKTHDAYIVIEPSSISDQVTPHFFEYEWQQIKGLGGNTTLEWFDGRSYLVEPRPVFTQGVTAAPPKENNPKINVQGIPTENRDMNILYIKRTIGNESKVISIPLLQNGEKHQIKVNKVITYNNIVWFATAYGLVALNPETLEYKLYTKNEGLMSNNINKIWIEGDTIVAESEKNYFYR